MEAKLIEWFGKHFGHILTGRTDTAEHARTAAAFDSMVALVNEPQIPFTAPPVDEKPIKVAKVKKIEVQAVESPQELVAPVVSLPAENADSNPSK